MILAEGSATILAEPAGATTPVTMILVARGGDAAAVTIGLRRSRRRIVLRRSRRRPAIS